MASPARVLSRPGVVVLALALSVSLASPAAAARKAPSAVSGWSTSVLDVREGQTVTVPVRVRPAGKRHVRRVSLERRTGTAAWRTVATARTNARAVATLRFQATAASVSQLRVVVAPTRRARSVTSRVRTLVVTGGGAGVSTGASMAEAEAEVLRLTNLARGEARTCGSTRFAATGPVRADAALTSASRAHARDMGVNSYFSHTSQDGRSLVDRALAAGYRATGIGENIAAGQPTPQSVVEAWLASPGHCQNLMRASWVDLGVGYVVTPGAPYRGYWVQMFGDGRVR